MLLFGYPIIFITILSYATASIHSLTNPILPISLGNSRIIAGKHTFVSYINISNYFELRNNIILQLNFINNKNDTSDMAQELIKQAWSMLQQVDDLLQVIDAKNRKRRGLFNIGGSISKWLFGTLDHEDGEKIDSILNHLNKQNHLLQDRINTHTTIAENFMAKINSTLNQMKSNILISKHLIDKYQIEINTINILHLIINSLIGLQNSLTQLVNSITFAYLNKIHPTFLPMNDLEAINGKMASLYDKSQLVHFKHTYSYYEFMGVQIVFSEDRIIFLVHYPLLNPRWFKTFFIYPIPIQGQIILPPKPYLILNEKTEELQYEEEICEKIDDTFYCKNHLETNIDCVAAIIIQNNASRCTSVPVNIETHTVNQINSKNILMTTPTSLLVNEICEVERQSQVPPGSYLISLSGKCHVKIDKEVFYSEEETFPRSTHLIQLSPLNMTTVTQMHKSTIKLKTMDLKEIQHLTSIMHDQNKLVLPEVIKTTSDMSWLWIVFLGIVSCLVTYLVVSCYYKISYPFPLLDLHSLRSPRQPDQP